MHVIDRCSCNQGQTRLTIVLLISSVLTAGNSITLKTDELRNEEMM